MFEATLKLAQIRFPKHSFQEGQNVEGWDFSLTLIRKQQGMRLRMIGLNTLEEVLILYHDFCPNIY